MAIFKPKSGAIFQWSRFVHFCLALTVTSYGGHLWGYEGSVFAALGAIVGGFGWEVSNRFTGGYHPFGDAIDWWAFVLGAVAGGVGWLIVG